jgi:heat-inducible transcriptional repressor
MVFNERSHQVLFAVVGSYIKDALPIGSRTLVQNYDFGLSPATIRNIMAELEEMGYLSQPHTSAGRVPTERGYRYYVDSLIARPEDYGAPFGIEAQRLASKRDDMRELFQETSQLLSLMSHYTGIVMGPDVSYTLFKQIEFIRLRAGHFLVILITQDGFIQNRIIETPEDLDQRDLDRIARFLNETFSGLDLQEVRRRLLSEMETEKTQYDEMLKKVLELGKKAMRVEPECELFLGGTSHFLDQPEFSDLEKMRSLLTAFEEKAVIVKLLNRCMEGSGVQVFIGSENESRHMGDCSLVIANYKCGDRIMGTVAVLGPTRMEYERVIPLVDRTAKVLTRVLNED